MSKEQAIIHYQTVMAVFRSWLTQGVISAEELRNLEATVADKDGLSLSSIYRHITAFSACSCLYFTILSLLVSTIFFARCCPKYFNMVRSQQ